ncbi:hypothetical protein NA56DRAFT_650754 [Hyaloscypha hepaticicola]|uniref:MFS general substrate transporter n=1 Tax=Hyaloscypha hepaticicola TaxID=2082293 RepID=A0A2J6PKT3_9HELO|nr:hypothetical protein NA56DRAFT_650754 [Hyaloscypha hepaticicola]
MELDDINAGVASHEGAEKKKLQEIERAEDVDIAKHNGENIDYAAEKRLVRKLDFWIVPLMMATYTLQSYDKGIISAATQFGFNTDLGLTVTIGHKKAGVAITDNKKYFDASMMFYIGYLCGTYPMMYLSQRYSTSHVLALATFFWGTVVLSTARCYNYA